MTEQEFMAIWQSQQATPTELEYRLYYDDQGFPLCYSTEKIPGQYIVIDKQTYVDGSKHIRIINGQIKVVKIVYGKKLVPAQQGQACHSTDVAIVVGADQPHQCWNIKHEEPVDD
jgi:hypothetical protein